ncbi:MAG: GTP-binding protein [Promethearchaeota archaeon]|nr:MAG: GTP-binding protein [Candidatus Lokiarchaeota archaeon]
MSTVSPKPKPYKILIMGLDNSGKTSILISLSKDSNILSYCSIKPTIGCDIKTIETQDLLMSIWDFGGQAKFREEYLTNFKNYLEGANKIIFVIDVQDIKRYELALEYFKNILNLLKEGGYFIELSIFLHKYDPNLSMKEEFEKIDEIVESKLINELIGIIPPEFDYKLFKTSIYTVFDKYLIQMK